MLCLVVDMNHQRSKLRQVITWQFHDKRREFFSLSSPVHQKNRDHSEDHRSEINTVKDKVWSRDVEACHQRASDSDDDRKFRRAGEERNDTDGACSLFFRREGSRVHHRRDRTTKSHDHREEHLSGKSEAMENTIEKIRDSCHISAVF